MNPSGCTNYDSSSLSNSSAWYLRAFLFGFASDAPLGGRGAAGGFSGSAGDFLLFCSSSSAFSALISSWAFVSTIGIEAAALADGLELVAIAACNSGAVRAGGGDLEAEM